MISVNQLITQNNKQINPNNSPTPEFGKPWKKKAIPVTNKKEELPVKRGQALLLTMWKRCAFQLYFIFTLDFNIYFMYNAHF